jgi:hypothetical protein
MPGTHGDDRCAHGHIDPGIDGGAKAQVGYKPGYPTVDPMKPVSLVEQEQQSTETAKPFLVHALH